MLGRLGSLAIGLLSLGFATDGLAQVGKVSSATPLELGTAPGRASTVARLAAEARREKERAEGTARAQGWPVRGVQASGRIFELRRLDGQGHPLYNATNNVNAAISTGANLVRNVAPYSVNGNGFRVGVWDGGSIRSTHQEFPGRVFVLDGASAIDHATHVGGTIGAAGTNASALGMAPSVRLDSYDWNNDVAEMAAAAATTTAHTGKVLISNHSYGFLSGWETGTWSGSSGPHYWGTYPQREDSKFGLYGSDAVDWDNICYSAPYYLPFKSAGNDRNDSAPTAGTSFYYFSGSAWVSKVYDGGVDPFADGFDNGGFDTMETQASAKNIMTIGAADDAVSAGVRSVANGTIASFSGWGPTDDGRIKPDLVANGVNLTSSLATSDSAYGVYSGTSMSTPNAAGSAILLQQLYSNNFAGKVMRSSTLKGLLIHTADDAGNPGPDYSYGWGYMNVKSAADYIRNPATTSIVEARLYPGKVTDTYTFAWNGSTPIRATICWTDPAGAAKSALDDRTRVLVNDLDLRITKGASTFLPYVLDVNNPAANATLGDNITDNVEQVLIASPSAGTYTLTVSHKGTITGGEQGYALILSEAVPAVPIITSALSATAIQTQAFSYQIVASNNPTSYGATGLPAGLGINTATGLISGTPTVSGTFNITLSATNGIGTGTAPLSLPVSLTGPPTTVFDSFTGGTYTLTGSTPRSFMGSPMLVTGAGGTSNIGVSGGTAYLVSTAAVNYANVRLNLTFWGGATNATSGSTSAFSNPLGTFSFDLGALNALAGTFYTVDFTLPSTVILPTQVCAVTCNWQGDTGSGLVNTDNLTSLLRYGAGLSAGTLTAGAAGTHGFYRNAGGETNGNFLGSSFRSFAGLANQSLALKLLALSDAASPTVSVTPTGTVTNSSPITFTLAFSETVTGLASGELVVTGGTIGTFSGSGAVYTASVIPAGQGTVTCQVSAGAAQDGAGNNNLVSNVASVTFDSVTQAPTLTAPAPGGIVSSSIAVSFSLPEPALSNSVQLLFTGPVSRTLTLAASQETSGPHSFSFNPANPTSSSQIASGASIPDGVYTVTLSYLDALGNPAATAASANVRIDTMPPALNLPANITVTATSPSGANVTYPFAPTDTGGSGVATFGAVPASGSLFPIATTTVNATATDLAGNVANGSFNVTVNPNAGPTGGTFVITPNTGVHQGDPLTLTAAGWTDPDLPLTYQFFNGVTPLNSPSASHTLNSFAPAPGSYTLKVRVTDTVNSFTETTQPLTVVAFSPVETWRQSYFGDFHNTGSFADGADFDVDGLVNLLEFAFGTSPIDPGSGSGSLRYDGTLAGSGTLVATGAPVFAAEGTDRRALFVRRADFATAGLSYTVEFSPKDFSTWEASATAPTVLASAGLFQIVSVPFPLLVGGQPPHFLRLRVNIAP